MHELTLSRAIVDAAVRHAEGRPVTAVHVRVGAMRQAVPSTLEFCFGLASRDTACAEARLETEPVAALLRCPQCGREWDPAPPPLAVHGELPGNGLPALPAFGCPACGAGGEVVAGGELEVAWIEVEDA
jgi:hydrogenase nickel incorporation protein HypA/HybF